MVFNLMPEAIDYRVGFAIAVGTGAAGLYLLEKLESWFYDRMVERGPPDSHGADLTGSREYARDFGRAFDELFGSNRNSGPKYIPMDPAEIFGP